jgi:hypoxanthine-guanine phosphoribosyltransferase
MESGSKCEIHPDIQEVIWSSVQLHDRVIELGRELATAYADKEPLLLVTLAGAFVFAADLVRHISPVPPGLQIDFIRASSYGARTSSSGSVTVTQVQRTNSNLCRRQKVGTDDGQIRRESPSPRS